MTRVGVLPYLWLGHDLRIVIISSRDGDRWVLPKGRPKSGLSRRALAQLEAWEEAGVTGALKPTRPIDVFIRRGTGRQSLRLYPMRVDSLAETWPEQSDRQRIIVAPAEAQNLLSDEGMAEAVAALMPRLFKAPNGKAPFRIESSQLPGG